MVTKDQITEFLARLEGPEGCDFQQKDPEDPKTITWSCGGGVDKSKSRAILEKMGIPNRDIDRIFTIASISGGHCDCEILMNATDALLAAPVLQED